MGVRSSGKLCKSCSSQDLAVFYRVTSVPVNSCLLFDNQQEAQRYPTGEIALGFCRACGFVSNIRFDPAVLRYTEAYEEQQSFSSRFTTFARDLAVHLVERYNLRDKTIVEIGCGKGDFLFLLCEVGNNRGIGIDSTYIPGRTQSSAAERVTFIRDFYSERYGHYGNDLVCCRHTLEHIPETAAFVHTVRRAIGNHADTIVFFEVPDVTRVLRESAFWDIYYEHCSYFSLGSLARLFRSCGFEILDLAKAFDDQYLLLEARPVNGNRQARLKQEDDLDQLARDVAYFQEHHQAKVEGWKQKAREIQRKGQRAVIWGSSSKCVAFMSTLGIQNEIEFVVDINPHRQGKYLPGSGKKIVAPDFLKDCRPDVVIAMNPIYLQEIQQDLNRLGLSPELTAV